MIKNGIQLTTQFAEKMKSFEIEARNILSTHETSPDRVITLTTTRQAIVGLSLRQAQLFRQAVRCVEHRIYKAAHVMAWAAFMDFLEDKLTEDNFRHLHNAFPNWTDWAAVEDLRENVVEHQLIGAAHRLSLIGKSEEKILQGLLAKRNECAHPSSYSPGMNETLGYVGELLQRIKDIQRRSCKVRPKKPRKQKD
ncbi:hypothetical protein [Paucidesulfovibrio longus]|uniref:hypothetical protein n=1 Tax=Paucidesulfovibrio longus TaxID=889 RepID=UPI0012DDD095|nr:hypothetical protein [Paucidesulfovibrio longus]